ncbi:MAG: hypothetical protein WBR26_08775 [Candidatus Acidiferrum sp.]
MTLFLVLDHSPGMPESPVSLLPTTPGSIQPLQLGRTCGPLVYEMPPIRAPFTLTLASGNSSSSIFTNDFLEAGCSY